MTRINPFEAKPLAPVASSIIRRERAIAGALVFVIAVTLVLPEAFAVIAHASEWRNAENVQRLNDAVPGELQRIEAELERRRPVTESGSKHGLAALLVQLSLSSNASGAQVERIEPSAVDKSSATSAQSVRVRVSGDGHSVGRFVDEFERGPVAMPVAFLAVTATQNGSIEAMINVEVLVDRGEMGADE